MLAGEACWCMLACALAWACLHTLDRPWRAPARLGAGQLGAAGIGGGDGGRVGAAGLAPQPQLPARRVRQRGAGRRRGALPGVPALALRHNAGAGAPAAHQRAVWCARQLFVRALLVLICILPGLCFDRALARYRPLAKLRSAQAGCPSSAHICFYLHSALWPPQLLAAWTSLQRFLLPMQRQHVDVPYRTKQGSDSGMLAPL